MPSSIDEILAAAENPAYVRTSIARVLLRQDLVARHDELDAALAEAKRRDEEAQREVLRRRAEQERYGGIGTSPVPDHEPEAPALAAEVEALEAEMEAAKVEFRFRSIGRHAWLDLLGKHPPTAQQRKASPMLDHNPESFPLAAIAASSADPVMTVDDVKRLEAALNDTQFTFLWVACLEANKGADVPKSRVAAGLNPRRNGGSATTAVSEASPAASSLA